MTELSTFSIGMTTLEKEMDLPEGAKIANIIFNPHRRIVDIVVAYDVKAKEIIGNKLLDLGKAYWEFVPDHMKPPQDKGFTENNHA